MVKKYQLSVMNIRNKLFFILSLIACQTLVGTESAADNLLKIKWDNNDINLVNGRDIILLDASSCMIIAPVYYEPGLAKYDFSSFSPDKKYYWMSISGIKKEISILNFGPVANGEIDVSEKIKLGRYVTIEGLDISKKYYIYKLAENGVDPYFFYSDFGAKFFNFKEKISPGKYLILEKQEHKIIASKVFDVSANENEERKIFQWSVIRNEKLGFDVNSLREYCDVSALCNLFYKKYRNSENSTFSCSHGYTFSFDEK